MKVIVSLVCKYGDDQRLFGKSCKTSAYLASSDEGTSGSPRYIAPRYGIRQAGISATFFLLKHVGLLFFPHFCYPPPSKGALDHRTSFLLTTQEVSKLFMAQLFSSLAVANPKSASTLSLRIPDSL